MKRRSAEIDRGFLKSLYMTMSRDALVLQVRYGNGQISPGSTKPISGSLLNVCREKKQNSTETYDAYEEPNNTARKLLLKILVPYREQ
jgi:hypothetical protein